MLPEEITGWFEEVVHVDTGFSGYLALPGRYIEQLQLARPKDEEEITIELADGSVFVSPVYKVVVEWDSTERATQVLVLEGEALTGTSLLFDFEVCIRFSNGGYVRIENKRVTNA